MLISLNWVKSYLPKLDISDEDLIKRIGARLVEVEGVDDQTHKYDGIYVVEVKECEKIEGTHLSRCLIDDQGRADKVERNADGLVQVMCGAPNVHQGMFAAWIAPGATVPASLRDAEPFVIGMRRMLKKYDSYGMMAGIDELDLGDDHSGILELNPAEVKAGQDFADALNLRDKILDIENKSLTHRPDTFGVIGFAREVAGILDLPFAAPAWTKEQGEAVHSDDIKIDIQIEDDKLCSRYSAIALNLREHPKNPYFGLEQADLAHAGMRGIDPIVDATNLLMLATGQPTHAFDLDKFVAISTGKSLDEVRKSAQLEAKIVVRAAKAGEKLTLLDGNEIELCADDIVILSGDQPVALAGAMGGANTEIDADTKRVLIESASFSLFNLRKTQMNHGIFTEAITRFTKGQPASQTMMVAQAVARKMAPFAEIIVTADSQDKAPAAKYVELPLSKINSLLGKQFSAEEVKRTLENVEFKVKLSELPGGDVQISAEVPAWRTDIAIPEDICEEVGRLTGFDNIAAVLPLHSTATPNLLFNFKDSCAEALSSYGANEVLTYSFVPGDLLQKMGQEPKNSYRIVNSISPELQYIRQSIVPSLLDKSYANLRAGYPEFALFEMNQVYAKDAGIFEDTVPNNQHQLGFVYLNSESKSCYYSAKLYLERLLARENVNFELRAFEAAEDKSNAYYEGIRSASIYVDAEKLGYLGEIRADVLRSLKLPLGTAAFELDLEKLAEKTNSKKFTLRLSNYPAVSRDLTITIAKDAAYAPIEAALRQALEARGLYYKLHCSSIYCAEGSTTKNLSFHLEFSDPEKTLTKADIQDIMKTLEKIK